MDKLAQHHLFLILSASTSDHMEGFLAACTNKNII